MGYYSSKTPVCKALLAGAAILVFTSTIHTIEGKLCGKRLSQTLALVCDLYPTLAPGNKRAQDTVGNGHSLFGLQDWSNAVENQEDKFKIIPNWMKALYPKDSNYNLMIEDDVNEIMPSSLRPGKRGIVEECCHNDCTLEHLIKYYCAN